MLADSQRSCTRGLGAPAKALALPFERLDTLKGHRDPLTSVGPLCARNLVVVGSWFLCREVEISLALASSTSLERSTGSLRGHWRLPVSKTDPSGLGVSRYHVCVCPEHRASAACPVHCIWDQLLFLQRRFPERFSGETDAFGLRTPDASLPLFPNERGKHCDKRGVVEAIIQAGKTLGVVETADGAEKISGHSLRATGAQGLARRGLDLWAIQLLGRWGSDAVKGYVRGAQLEHAATRAARGTNHWDIEALVAEVLRRTAMVQGDDSDEKKTSKTMNTVVQEVTKQSHGLDLGPILAEEVRLTQAAADPCVAPAAATVEEKADDYVLVENLATRVWHRTSFQLKAGAYQDATALCGWKFGLANRHSRLGPWTSLPLDPFQLCSRCLPLQRTAALKSITQHVTGKMES